MIKVEHLTKKFKEKTIFENITCNLEAGKSYAIVAIVVLAKQLFLMF